MVNDNDLRNYAETWIRISTVLLAFELAIVTFAVGYLKDSQSIVLYLYLSLGMIGAMVSALLIFIIARDPRRTDYSTHSLLDLGGAAVVVSAFFGSLIVGYGTFFITGDLILAMVMFVGGSLVVSIAYPIYYRLVNKRKKDTHDD